MSAAMNIYPMTVYYDHSCPLCREEMFALKAYDAENRLQLIDCSIANFSSAEAGKAGYTQQQMMRLIHAQCAGI
jgi:predicted DCC family thiol-disulfide oxidoreductase YuxK